MRFCFVLCCGDSSYCYHQVFSLISFYIAVFVGANFDFEDTTKSKKRKWRWLWIKIGECWYQLCVVVLHFISAVRCWNCIGIWQQDSSVSRALNVGVDSALHPSCSIKWVAQCVDITGTLCWWLIHPTEMYEISSCTPWLKDIAKRLAPLYCGYQPCAV